MHGHMNVKFIDYVVKAVPSTSTNTEEVLSGTQCKKHRPDNTEISTSNKDNKIGPDVCRQWGKNTL